jgi:hypothetical protein
MRPLANLREGSLLMSVSPLKACPFNAGTVCVSTAIVCRGRRGRRPRKCGCRRLKKATGILGILFPLLLLDMFGAFHPTSVAFGGLLWSVLCLLCRRKTEQGQENAMEVVCDAQGECAWPPQEGGRGHRCRPCKWRSVQGFGEHSTTPTWHPLNPTQDRAMLLPKEHEMVPKDKYTVFCSTARGYRKGIHKVPKWTRVCPHFTLVEPLLTVAF